MKGIRTFGSGRAHWQELKETPRDHESDHGADGSDEWACIKLNYRPHTYQA